MIRPALLAQVLGRFLLGFTCAMVFSLALEVVLIGEVAWPVAYAAVPTAVFGAALAFGVRRTEGELSVREGLLLAVSVWLSACFFGSLPFYFSPHFGTFADAFFEATSGFTTTGATILGDVEVLSHSIQFWRCVTHWFGGMGILVLVIAILPLLGTGGVHLYRAEFSGAKSEKLRPRITETALALWKIYLALTSIDLIALRLAGMPWFDAVCHAFSTSGTGGFSTRTASIGAFNSPLIEYIVIVFMVLGGVNFTLHYRLWVERNPRSFFGDAELRAYALAIAVCSVLISASLIAQRGYALEPAFRSALFQTTAILTTTGFATDDYVQWAPLPQTLLLALMFIGGCTGSTSGGLKVARMILLFRIVGRELKRIVERRGVFTIRLGDRVVPETVVHNTMNIFYLAFIVNFVASLMLAAAGVDVFTSISAVTACMFNIGPGLGSVGPTENYGHLPGFAKWVLSGCMIAGRLEFYTAIVIWTPAFWRK